MSNADQSGGNATAYRPQVGKSLKLLAWKGITMPIMGVIYCMVISEGMRLLVPALGQPLHKLPIPGLSQLRGFRGVNRLDLAHLMAIMLLFAVWHLWCVILRISLGANDVLARSGWDPVAYGRFVMGLGIVVLGADMILFYIALAYMEWGRPAFSFPAIIGTIAYVGVIIFVSFMTVNLHRPIMEGK